MVPLEGWRLVLFWDHLLVSLFCFHKVSKQSFESHLSADRLHRWRENVTFFNVNVAFTLGEYVFILLFYLYAAQIITGKKEPCFLFATRAGIACLFILVLLVIGNIKQELQWHFIQVSAWAYSASKQY